MQLESLETAGADPAVHPPAAAMHQSPESMENAGQARPQRWLGHRPQRMVYEFARPVFRRCGRHLRAQKWFSNSEYTCFRITKIGEDEGRSYPAIVNQPMAPNTGVYRWTWVLRGSHAGIVMPGVCTEAADPDHHSLRFQPHGAAYECWTGLIYGFGQNTNNGHPTARTGCRHREGDEIAFKLDTNQGVLEIYHSYYGCIYRMHVPGMTLYAYCGLEEPGDVVEYVKIDHNFPNPYFCHSRNTYYTRMNEPPRPRHENVDLRFDPVLGTQ